MTNQLAEILFKIIDARLKGVYHVAGSESISKLDFGYRIAEIFELEKSPIIPSYIEDVELKAKRPLNPSLNCQKIQNELSITLPSVVEGIYEFKRLEESEYLTQLKNL